ncbi:MAG: hypothetical protein LUH04_05325, partial [Clostridium sp.]|nr:hypothetical protein [Clostridium sp.]
MVDSTAKLPVQWRAYADHLALSKVSEGNSSAVWRIRNLDGFPMQLKISFTDQFKQPHAASFVLDQGPTSYNLKLPVMVNTLRIISLEGMEACEVWFG